MASIWSFPEKRRRRATLPVASLSQKGTLQMATTPQTTTATKDTTETSDLSETSREKGEQRTKQRRRRRHRTLPLRIRRTRESDLDAIAAILAEASSPTEGIKKPNMDWVSNMKSGMATLQRQGDYKRQIRCRWKAWEAGRKAILENSSHRDETGSLYWRRVWEHGDFVSLLERAAFSTTEDNPWQHHESFACLPQCPSTLLQHVMITAVTDDDKVVGFCEVALLPDPLAGGDDDDDDDDGCLVPPNLFEDDLASQCPYVPMIGNLVVSSSHRRRGVASDLVNCACRLVQTPLYWHMPTNDVDSSSSCHRHGGRRVGLYVEESNFAAQRLYERKGFREVDSGSINNGESQTSRKDQTQRIYMELSLNGRQATKD